MFAAADTLITLLIFAAVAIVSSWLQKKRKKGEEADPWGDGGGPAPTLPGKRETPATPKPSSWEEELRRLLQGEESTPPVARPQPPPRPQPAARPPPIPKAPPRVAAEEGEMDRGLAVDLPKLVESTRSYQRASTLDQKVKEYMHQRAGLASSASAYERASQLDLKIAERMKQVTEQTPSLPVPHRERAGLPETATVRAMLRDARSARSAVLASVILGPPRSLED